MLTTNYNCAITGAVAQPVTGTVAQQINWPYRSIQRSKSYSNVAIDIFQPQAGRSSCIHYLDMDIGLVWASQCHAW